MEDRCVVCSEIIPQGQQVCKNSENKVKEKEIKNMKNKMKKVIVTILTALTVSLGIIGCTEADKVSQNVSQEADNFNVLRRFAVINTRTDKVEFEMIGAFSLDAENSKKIRIICEMEDGTYKKHIIGLNSDSMYVVEDIGGAEVNKYKYEVNYIPESIVPFTVTEKK